MRRVTLIVAILWFLIVSPTWGQESPTPAEVEKLIEQLGDDNLQVRQAATEKLIAIGPPALDAVNKALTSEKPEVRIRARAIATKIAENKARFDRQNSISPPEFILPPLKDNLPTLEEMRRLENPVEYKAEESDHNEAANAEEFPTPPETIDKPSENKKGRTPASDPRAIIPLLKDPDKDIRASATAELATIDAKDLAPHLNEILPFMEDVAVRKKIAEVLTLKEPEELIGLLKKGPKELRETIVEIFAERKAEVHAEELLPFILPLLKDESWSARGRAAIALVELGRKADVPAEVIADIRLFASWEGRRGERARNALKQLREASQPVEER